MSNSADRFAAIVAVGAVMPDAADVNAFWSNIVAGKSSISEVPPDRWNAALYYDADLKAPDKTYSKIGGWVRDLEWHPLQWKLPIPPRVSDAMDLTQRLAIAAVRQVLADYGKPLDGERTAVILGNAMGGDNHLLTASRILFPEIMSELESGSTFQQLSPELQRTVKNELQASVRRRLPDITEDTMPGELGNVVAGRIAQLYDLKGPNFITDAACASAMAALNAAVEGLVNRAYDAVLTGGVDSNMSPSSFVKFSKIGALSATGSRPYAEGADGFVMGEGAACFMLKRLADAERDGDRIYAVIRGIGASSDGKGKGITAPNPVGQRLAVQRAWQHAGVKPEAGDLVEGHGTSTKVGDVVEVNSLAEIFRAAGVPERSAALGSVKSNIGHLKGAAGAAGILKSALALHHRLLPPSINFRAPNPDIDFTHNPFYVNTEAREWLKNGVSDGVRRAGVSSFGFGGTNFHIVLEQHVPGLHRPTAVAVTTTFEAEPKTPLRGALVVGGGSEAEIATRLRDIQARAQRGETPPLAPPAQADLAARVRVAIDYGNAAELADLSTRALEAIESNDDGRWRALRNKGVYLGRGAPGKVAFLFTGQGSQYVNMLRELSGAEAIVKQTFDEADAVMEPLIGAPLTEHIFLDKNDEAALARAEDALKQTAITQPAVLTVETALARVLGAYGIVPDMVMGHSLGEYGALVAAGALTFADALRAVSARGQAMAHLSLADQGTMAAVFGPLERVQEVIASVGGYVVIANINSTKECVIGGATEAMAAAMEGLKAAHIRVQQLAVSHAFHTDIVAPAAQPMREVLGTMAIKGPSTPIVANVTGEFYPSGANMREQVIDILGRQVGSAVQFVKGLNTLYDAGARVFVEVGPKRALFGFTEEVLGDRVAVTALYTNHPRMGDVVSLNRALCGLYALGLGGANEATTERSNEATTERSNDATKQRSNEATNTFVAAAPVAVPGAVASDDKYLKLGKLFTDFLDKSYAIYSGADQHTLKRVRVGITGASVGLPGTERLFDDGNIARLFAGEQLIRPISDALRNSMAVRGITRLVKGAAGEARFEVIDDPAHVLKLAARAGDFDLVRDFGYPQDRVQALDRVTEIAIAAGLEALRDAGIPLVQRYKTTTTGSQLPAGWSLPEDMRDDTGIIFASAYPGLNQFAAIIRRYYEHHTRCERLAELRSLRERLLFTDTRALEEIDERIAGLADEIEQNPHHFDRRFLFQVLNMGHAQFAEYIGARGPNVGTNGACSSGAQAVSMAKDWIETGRCRRVIVISADDVTTDELFPWFGSGFLASGVAATDERVEDAAVPFDRRRHGLIVGMGGAGIVVESIDAAAERGLQPICEMLGTVIANSAYHGSRLDVPHITSVMERLISQVEDQWQISRADIAADAVFVSHETYTPARGGSASAEVTALRTVFGKDADRLIIANTKGYTGHPMATAVEDVLAVKMLESGMIPPVPNYREVDPELGVLNLSHGGSHPVQYALRLGAGFGSQISMTLTRWLAPPDGARRTALDFGYQHRIQDAAAWRRWLQKAAGHDAPELEVVQRTLRVRNGVPAPATAPLPVTPVQPTEIAAAAAPPAAATDTAVRDRVLAIVAQQTGYPPDMLALDLDLEADLGIDTVKQAEMFAAIRAEYGIERDENIALRDYPTLAHAIQFVFAKRPDLQTAVQAPVPVADAPAIATTGANAEEAVAQSIIRIVSQQTGYPADMLALDLDLEADLGIDTVKQAEMFAAIRAEYGIERDENIALRDYPTLAHAIQFVFQKRPDLRAGGAPVAAAAIAADESHVPETAATTIVRRVPMASLRPEAAFFQQTAVRLGAGSSVVVAGAGPVAVTLADKLAARGVTVIAVDPAAPPATLSGVSGVYWLPALESVAHQDTIDTATRQAAIAARVKALYGLARSLYGDIQADSTFLIAATRLGGTHGYDSGALDEIGGAVCGFTKAFAREKPAAVVKAVDFEATADAESIADALIAETLFDRGIVEVGYARGLRQQISLREQPVSTAPLALGADAVFVVTGAAGSITSAILADLAKATRGTFWLLDLTPEPDAKDVALQRVTDDRAALKKDIFARLQQAGERATPALVEKEISRLERARAALDAIRSVQDAGGTVHYRSVDLRAGDAVRAITSEITAAHRRIDVLVHAAGIEISRALPDKTPEEFNLVFDVKVEGWFNVIGGLEARPIGAVVAFSSIAGRFGNAGQTDYSAANDLLCKALSAFSRIHPETRAVAIDWTAWADIGMASRGSIPAIMKAAGIDMLPPGTGIPAVRHELAAGYSGEVVVAGALGAMLHERAPQDVRLAGGTDVLAGADVRFTIQDGLAVDMKLEPRQQPFLRDHQINGVAVLPGVMALELMAEAATLPFGDRYVTAFDDVDFLAPFKFYRDEARSLKVVVQYRESADAIVASCRLIGERTLHGRTDAEQTLHFRAEITLSQQPAAARRKRRVPAPAPEAVSAHDIYRIYFHGPSYQVLAGAWRSDGKLIGSLKEGLPPDHTGSDAPLLIGPRLIELAFQTAGLAEISEAERMGLPYHIDRLELYARWPDDRHGANAVVAVPAAEGGFDIEVTDAKGTVLIVLHGYRTAALPETVDASAFAKLKT